jgi:hypothetical protein
MEAAYPISWNGIALLVLGYVLYVIVIQNKRISEQALIEKLETSLEV